MSLHIRPYRQSNYERVLEICIAAFTPIYQGLEEALGRKIFELRYQDWKEQYADCLGRISPTDPTTRVYVAELQGVTVGFVFTILDAERKTGEIGLNAVDPMRQGRGIGKAMYEFALSDLKERGVEIAYVGTGGDAAHAPARKAYEAIGFDKMIPGAHFFKVL